MTLNIKTVPGWLAAPRLLLAAMLPWHNVVFNAKHHSNKSSAICDMPPSGPIKMQPLFKIHPVLILLGSDLQRLAAYAYSLFFIGRFLKEPQSFSVSAARLVFLSLFDS